MIASCWGYSHPIDVVKTRLQVSGDEATGAKNYKALGISGTVRTIAAEEGIPAFWKGIGAAWLREATYTSLRLGLYDPIKHAFNVQKDSPFIFKFASGSLAGAIGSIAGNPFDVLKTRMMASAAKGTPKLVPTATELYQQQGKALKALVDLLYLSERQPAAVSSLSAGVKGFYRGIDANVMRAMVLNGTKMSCYDQIKSLIAQSGIVPAGTVSCADTSTSTSSPPIHTDLRPHPHFPFPALYPPPGLATQFVAAFGAGFFMACTVSPFDMVRTRLMNQPANVRLYNNFVDCFIKVG